MPASDTLLGCYVSWGRYSPDKDLAMRITKPNGVQIFVDSDPNACEVFYENLDSSGIGTWTVEVINHGKSRVRYNLTFGTE